MGYALAFLSAFGYTSQAILIRRGMMEKNPGSSAGAQLIVLLSSQVLLLLGVAVAIICGYNFLGELCALTPMSIILIVLEGILGPLTGLYLVTTAVGQIGAARSSALRSSNPLFTTAMAMLFLGERPTLIGLFSILVLVTGIILVSFRSQQEGIALLPRTKVAGSIIALLAGLSFAVAQIFRGAALRHGATPTTAVILGGFTAIIILVVISVVQNGRLNIFSGTNTRSLYFYILGGAGTLVGRYAQLVAFTLIPIWLTVSIRNIQPLIAILLTWLFLKKTEIINLRLIFGAALVVIGIITSVLLG